MPTVGDTSSINPWRRRNEMEESAQAALAALREQGEAKVALQKQNYEDSLLGQLTSKLKEGSSLYDPTISPIVAQVAGTRHAPFLNFLASAEQATRPQFFPQRPGEELTAIEYDKSTGKYVPRATGIKVPQRPYQDRSPNQFDLALAEADKQWAEEGVPNPTEQQRQSRAYEIIQTSKEELKQYSSQGKVASVADEYSWKQVGRDASGAPIYEPEKYTGKNQAKTYEKLLMDRRSIARDLEASRAKVDELYSKLSGTAQEPLYEPDPNDPKKMIPTTTGKIYEDALKRWNDQVKPDYDRQLSDVNKAITAIGAGGVEQPKPAASTGSSATAPPSIPKVGDTVKGYRFKGGNPADQNSWEKVQADTTRSATQAKPTAATTSRVEKKPTIKAEDIDLNDPVIKSIPFDTVKEYLAKYESSFGSAKANINNDGSVDLGRYMINSRNVTGKLSGTRLGNKLDEVFAQFGIGKKPEDRIDALMKRDDVNETVARAIYEDRGIGQWSTGRKALQDYYADKGTQ